MNQQPQPAQENKMGVMPVHRLLLTMSGPMMLSMLIQALYNVVDSMFVSYISEAALTAVSLAYPMQNLMIAVATGTGVGINALLSRNLGEKNFVMANRTAGNAIFLGLVSYGVFALLGVFGSRLYFTAQVEDPEIIALGCDYLSIILVLSIGCFGQVLLSRLLQSTGKTFYSMVIQMVGAVFPGWGWPARRWPRYSARWWARGWGSITTCGKTRRSAFPCPACGPASR